MVVMGVSGCGKSAVASGLAAAFGLRCVDADDLHSAEAVAAMRAGIALTDDDRWPWLDRVGAVLADAQGHPDGVVVACSALRRAYRERLRGACAGLRFVFLDGDEPTIAARLAQRQGHYMPPSLLRSQLRTLERPGEGEADVLHVDITTGLDVLVARTHERLAAAFGA